MAEGASHARRARAHPLAGRHRGGALQPRRRDPRVISALSADGVARNGRRSRGQGRHLRDRRRSTAARSRRPTSTRSAVTRTLTPRSSVVDVVRGRCGAPRSMSGRGRPTTRASTLAGGSSPSSAVEVGVGVVDVAGPVGERRPGTRRRRRSRVPSRSARSRSCCAAPSACSCSSGRSTEPSAEEQRPARGRSSAVGLSGSRSSTSWKQVDGLRRRCPAALSSMHARASVGRRLGASPVMVSPGSRRPDAWATSTPASTATTATPRDDDQQRGRATAAARPPRPPRGARRSPAAPRRCGRCSRRSGPGGRPRRCRRPPARRRGRPGSSSRKSRSSSSAARRSESRQGRGAHRPAPSPCGSASAAATRARSSSVACTSPAAAASGRTRRPGRRWPRRSRPPG